MEMDARILVAGGMGGERLRVILDGRQFLGKPLHPPLDGALVRFQPRIVDNEFRFLSHCG